MSSGCSACSSGCRVGLMLLRQRARQHAGQGVRQHRLLHHHTEVKVVRPAAGIRQPRALHPHRERRLLDDHRGCVGASLQLQARSKAGDRGCGGSAHNKKHNRAGMHSTQTPSHHQGPACAHLGRFVPNHAALDACQPPLLQLLHAAAGRRQRGCNAVRRWSGSRSGWSVRAGALAGRVLDSRRPSHLSCPPLPLLAATSPRQSDKR